ncbi:MAG: peroxiredoxin [Acidobacteriota bacterium]|nr:peroxiredoxin [Acidobacteriota bacterium]
MPQLALSAGDLGPDFELQSTAGQSVHLYRTLEDSSVVLFFYVRAFTPVCMAEVCSFRDNAADFAGLNAAIYGISSDTDSVAQRFASFHKLPFPLLVDEGSRVRNLYRVPKMFGFLPGRSTYVIGQNKRILQVTNGGLESSPHIRESLKALKTL